MSGSGHAPLLRVEGLRTWFPIRAGVLQRTVGYVRAVDDVDFEIPPGETLALVGESGCGKTTVARSLLRLVEPREAGGCCSTASISSRCPTSELHPYRRDIQIVFQDPMASLDPRMRVRDAIAEGMQAFGIGADEAERTRAGRGAPATGCSSTRTRCGATRTSSPAASASASASPARWPSSRG